MKKLTLIFYLMLALAFLALILFSGCKKELVEDKGIAEDEGMKEGTRELEQCIAACLNAIEKNQSLERGPCLLDPIENTSWVCDIAHWPREQVDNLRENQCNAWHNGTAKHFIELTPECKFIRAL